jgi:hypothetical protein
MACLYLLNAVVRVFVLFFIFELRVLGRGVIFGRDLVFRRLV